VIKFIAKMFD